MKQYTADKHAQYTLQIATPIVTAVLIGLVWYFLAVLPHWLLWTRQCWRQQRSCCPHCCCLCGSAL